MPSSEGELPPEAENDPPGSPTAAKGEDAWDSSGKNPRETVWYSWKALTETRSAADSAMLNTLILQAELERAKERTAIESRSRIFRVIGSFVALAAGVAFAVPVALFLITTSAGSIQFHTSAVWVLAFTAMGAALVFVTLSVGNTRKRRREEAEYQTALSRAEEALVSMAVQIRDKEEQVAILQKKIAASQEHYSGERTETAGSSETREGVRRMTPDGK